MTHYDDSQADDLQPVVDMLRAHRPEATALELDAVKQRVRARVARQPAGRRARSATFMKSRLAIIGMLVAGMLASTTGAGLAITGFASNDASVYQYGTPTPTPTPTPAGGVKGGHEQHHPSTPAGGTVGGGTPSNGGNTPTTTPLQPSRQVETGAGGGQLPFTGFLAIPVLIIGIALLGTGLVLRRRAADEGA